jgi:hypothetical protein
VSRGGFRQNRNHLAAPWQSGAIHLTLFLLTRSGKVCKQGVGRKLNMRGFHSFRGKVFFRLGLEREPEGTCTLRLSDLELTETQTLNRVSAICRRRARCQPAPASYGALRQAAK